jgi:hypothetical protein
MSTALEQTICLGPDANGIAMSPQEFDAIDDWDRDYMRDYIEKHRE